MKSLRIGAEIYIDFENSCVDVTDCSVEREGVLLTPYKGELYPKRRALQDYLFEEGVDTSDYSNDWQYIYGTGRNYDFHEYYNQIIDSLLAERRCHILVSPFRSHTLPAYPVWQSSQILPTYHIHYSHSVVFLSRFFSEP